MIMLQSQQMQRNSIEPPPVSFSLRLSDLLSQDKFISGTLSLAELRERVCLAF